MESIASHLSLNISSLATSSPQVQTPQETSESVSSIEKGKQLQPDQLALSEEAKAKSTEAEKSDEDKKNIDASSLGNVMTADEAAAAEKAQESELDKEIRELSMEILELSVKIQMLQDKEDKESVKERQSLEVDLAIKKGQLEAAMDRKLQQAAAGG
jgi:hypothetical protein